MYASQPILPSRVGCSNLSMNKWLYGAVSILIALIIGALASYYLAKRHFEAQIEALIPKVEQVIIRDTLRVTEPVFIEKRVVAHDTVKIALVDTLVRRDTLYLPREQKVYEDSTYRAYVSGVSPKLDSIYVYQKTVVETKIATQKEWRKFDYGLQAGVGLVCPVTSKPTFGFYVGFGVNYHF